MFKFTSHTTSLLKRGSGWRKHWNTLCFLVQCSFTENSLRHLLGLDRMKKRVLRRGKERKKKKEPLIDLIKSREKIRCNSLLTLGIHPQTHINIPVQPLKRFKVSIKVNLLRLLLLSVVSSYHVLVVLPYIHLLPRTPWHNFRLQDNSSGSVFP